MFLKSKKQRQINIVFNLRKKKKGRTKQIILLRVLSPETML